MILMGVLHTKSGQETLDDVDGPPELAIGYRAGMWEASAPYATTNRCAAGMWESVSAHTETTNDYEA